jgi:catechol 2,3-dioxygenase-like lactoylglutathione lyase family enzyme
MADVLTCGVHHVGLTVQDLDEAVMFFCEALGWTELGRNTTYPAAFVSDGSITLTLWRVADPDNAVAFDRRSNIGLHHLALAVENEADLTRTYDRVRVLPGVAVEFPPGPMRAGSATTHFICAMPGGPRIEFATRSS